MTKQKSCEERIKEKLKGRIADFKRALESAKKNDGKVIMDDETYEDLIDWLNNYALTYEDHPHYRAKKLELSWGGPQDYFLFFEDGTIEYHFLDWLDGAKRELNGKDKEVMQEIYEKYLNF